MKPYVLAVVLVAALFMLPIAFVIGLFFNAIGGQR